ncbi:MAG: tetratricopeptide repeat protein [Calothrix sp. FI2-JRJ7]|jgi:tetratricopeptide (TPR) repeat protein|nr:tetratricopeptide repeat protein [Calothrix sp. FI2-JRJ7]
MDWITVLRWLQSDFINRLSSGSLLHCPNDGQHSELTKIDGTRLNSLRNFCWRMAEKYKRVSPVRDVFTSFLKGKLGEELVKERLAGFITEVDYEQHLGGDGNVDFTLTANPLIGVEVKSRCGSFDTVKWSVTSEEVAKNAVIVCVLIQEKINEAQSEYNLVLAGFLPTAMIKLKTGRISFGIQQLMYGGGLVCYLEQLLSNSGSSLATYHSNRDKLPVYQYISSGEQGKYEHEPDSQHSSESLVHLYIQNGDDSFQRANYEAAIIAYNGALKIDVNNADIYYKIATAKYQFGDYEGAIYSCQQAVNINPNYLKAYQRSGLARYQIGDCEGAIVDFTQAIRINPHDAFAYLNRAYARSHLGDNQGAIEDYTQAIKLNPDANISLPAEITPITTTEITPNTSEEFKTRGNSRYEVGDYTGAVADYTEAIKLNISDANAYFNRANAKYENGDFRGAVEDYTQVIKINPSDAEAYFYRGDVNSQLGDKQAAVEDYNKAVDLYYSEGKLVEYRNARERILDIEIETSIDSLNF